MYHLKLSHLCEGKIFFLPPTICLLQLKQWRTCCDSPRITAAVVSGREESLVPKDYFRLCHCQPRLFTQLLDQLQ